MNKTDSFEAEIAESNKLKYQRALTKMVSTLVRVKCREAIFMESWLSDQKNQINCRKTEHGRHNSQGRNPRKA